MSFKKFLVFLYLIFFSRTCLSWEVECVDCDRTGAKSHLKPVAVGLREYKSFVAHVYRRQLLTLGPKAEFIADNLKRYL